MGVVLPIICQRLLQSIVQHHFGRPAEELLDLLEVGVVIANVDGSAVFGKRNQLVLSAAVELD